jgi:hypothetical protein
MIGMRFVGDVEEAPATQSTTVDVVHQSRQKLVEERPVAPAGGVVLPAEDFPLPAVDVGDDLRTMSGAPLGEQM